MRFDGGSASRRRICATSARSLSRRSGRRTFALRRLPGFFFIQRLPQYPGHRPIPVTHEAIQARRRIEGMQDHRLEIVRQPFQLAKVQRRLPEQKVQILRRDGRPLKRRGGVTDQDRLQLALGQQARDESEQRCPFVLPFFGSPAFALRHMIGAAGVGRIPALEQNVASAHRLASCAPKSPSILAPGSGTPASGSRCRASRPRRQRQVSGSPSG